ncbi:phage portal protein [Nocardioides phosphati]|uniref:Phage portal protein n=1 Tax=Nocardioides phosphati TaxID=1867775 RepID=A0ABQ2N6W3_9ACTN|nr:phage portal protein [Nocardioides phosphati]GGO86637.1 phage portal protein [Nocardioides phosphati]
MSLFFRSSRPEARDISSLPWSHGGDSPIADASLEGSLGLIPVYASVRLVSEAVASLPLQAYRKGADGERQAMTLPAVFDSPSNRGTRIDWLQRCMTSLLLRGNAYGLIVGSDRDTPGMPKMIEWLHPDKVRLHDGRWYYNGREIPDAQMLHIPAMVLPGSRLGVSPLSACSAAITAGKSTEQFMASWYGNRAIPSVHVQNADKTLTPEEAAVVKERTLATMRAGEPFVTGKDWKLDFLSLSANDAGFVSAARLTASQVASIFGIPPEMVGGEAAGSLTYSTVELNQIQFLTNSLRPWLVRLEAAFSSMMRPGEYVKFNVDSLIRVDTKTRFEVHKIAREIGLHNVDEIRRLEDEAPLPNGQGQDYTPLATKAAAATEKRSQEEGS